MIHTKFSMFVDRPGVMARIERKRLRVLSKVGAYSRSAMQRQIRAPNAGRKNRTVTIEGRAYFVPVRGRVIDVASSRAATTEQAIEARRLLAQQLGRKGAGKPPRRGPTDLLRKHIYFGIDEATESAIIGPLRFDSQPSLVGASSIPELLEQGGGQFIGDMLVKYDPHPFAAPTMPIAEQKFRELIESEPL